MKEAKNSLHKTSDFGVSNFLIQNKLSSNENTNVASFGTIQVYETGLCQFSLYNSGNYTIEFSWKFQKFNSDMVNVFLNKNRKHATNIHDNYRKSVNYEISNELNEQFHIHTDVSVVPTNYTANIIIEWKPTKKYNLEGTFINFFIINGPQYKIALMGRSMKPAIQFSFTNYDFGPCLIKSNPSKCNLIMSNTDTRIVSLSHRWENDQSTSDEMSEESKKIFSCDFDSCILESGYTKSIEFLFDSKNVKYYTTNFILIINERTEKNIRLTGHGVEVDLRLIYVSPTHNERLMSTPNRDSLDVFATGPISIGQTILKSFTFENLTPVSLCFKLYTIPSNISEFFDIHIKPLKWIKLGTKGKDYALKEHSTKSNLSKRKNQKLESSRKMTIEFTPLKRNTNFNFGIIANDYYSLWSKKLVTICGDVKSMSAKLSIDTISFQFVTLGNNMKKTIIIENDGDERIEFEFESIKEHFSINPTNGILKSEESLPLEITFYPLYASNDIRCNNLVCKIKPKIKKKSNVIKNIFLTLTGICLPPISQKEIVNFSVPVRMSETRSITLVNKTHLNWIISPQIEGKYFETVKFINIESQQSKNVDITYKPLKQTTDNIKHFGSIFFPLPDGSALLYKIIGVAEAPKASDKIYMDIAAKAWHEIPLSVVNVLPISQRLRIQFEPIKPDKFEPGTLIKNDYNININALEKKTVIIKIYTYKESIQQFKIHLINDENGENMFYDVTIRSTKPNNIEKIKLSTFVRRSIQHSIKINNPLNIAVILSIYCSSQDILTANQLAIPADSMGVIAMEYFPLKAGNFTSQMEINCPELGSYPYELELTATEAQYESPVNFRTVLGSHVTRNFTFFNYARQKTEYICKMDNTDFIVERSIAAAAGSGPGGTEINFDVTFEPSKLGPSTAILKASSGAGGVYKWSLHAIADSPKAQGPLTFKSGQTINLTFKNVFFQPTTFEFNIDSPHFHLARKSDTVRPRRDCRIPISYEEPNVQESNENKTKDKFQKLGKLIVSCSIPLITQTDEPKKANEIETKTNNSKKQAIQNEEEKQINYTRYEWIYYLCSNVH